jgi:hypothetical protein
MANPFQPGACRSRVRADKRGFRAVVAACAGFLAACGQSVYPDRDPVTVENIRVEGARFLPLGGRFILADSASGIRLIGIHTGYKCSDILEMGLAASPAGNPPAFLPRTRIRLPAAPDCAVDSAGRDTSIARVFPAGPDMVRLANSSGVITDTATVIRGTLEYDSLIAVPTLGFITKGPWIFRDSSAIGPRKLFGDSLSSCRILNHANWSKVKDTLKVRFSIVTRDSSAAPDTCHGAFRLDSLDPAAYVE